MRFSLCALLHLLTALHLTNAVGSCLDLLKSGVQTNGYYTVEAKGETWKVYCDFTSEPDSAWTLVMSWSHANSRTPGFHSKSLTQDAPVNERIPNWDVYRMSRGQMSKLRAQSSHWRATCGFDKFDVGFKKEMRVDYRDYMRGKFSEFDITTYTGKGACKPVEYINIRGYGGHETVRMWQIPDSCFLHIDSSYPGCQFNAKSGSKPSEDNFGHYSVSNANFRCTSGPTATTQYWFGGYIEI